MNTFVETVKWDDADKFRDNLEYGINRPVLENTNLQREGMYVADNTIFGKTIYQYDFGRLGTVTDFRFTGRDFVKFRIKVATSVSGLDQASYFGTERDNFSGSTIDSSKYTAEPNAFNLEQSGGISITGTQSGTSGVFEDPARLILNETLSGTYTVTTAMRLLINPDEPRDSGVLSFLELSTGTDTIQVQKYYAQIRTRAVDAYGNSLGRDVNSNDIILGEPISIAVNDVEVEATTILSDGTFGHIEDFVREPEEQETLVDMKTVDSVVDFFDRVSLDCDCLRVLGLRADYTLTGILSDLQQGLYYRPKRIHNYYAMRAPIVEARADLFASDIRSLNLDLQTGEYVFSETDDRWSITTLVPAGVHYYYFLVDGAKQLDALNPNTVTIASGEHSTITLDSTQFVEFVHEGPAAEVFLVGTFNNFNEQSLPLEVGLDTSEVLKVTFDEEVYCNDHNDWNMVEINFECSIPIIGIRFLTEVSFDRQQRVRIELDDNWVTSDQWELGNAPAGQEDVGVSPCAEFVNIFAGTYAAEKQSYWDNNVDVITASEDGWIEWTYKYEEPINFRPIGSYQRVRLYSRLENLAIYKRTHKALQILIPSTTATKVTDFLVSDNEAAFRSRRRTEACMDGHWSIPQLVLQEGINILEPAEINNESATYGDTFSVVLTTPKTFVEPFNQSELAVNNVEVVCTLADQLQYEPEEVLSVVDLGAEEDGYDGYGGDTFRFTRETFTRASDHLRVVVINIEIEPVGVYYLHLTGQVGYFRIEVYEAEEDALNRANILGYMDSTAYGYQDQDDFGAYVPLRQLETPSGFADVTVTNVIACFDEHAADTTFRTMPRANI